jgi:hypothetical protein
MEPLKQGQYRGKVAARQKKLKDRLEDHISTKAVGNTSSFVS